MAKFYLKKKNKQKTPNIRKTVSLAKTLSKTYAHGIYDRNKYEYNKNSTCIKLAIDPFGNADKQK